ncbi:Rz-like spanin [Klebsiella phage BUCT610]|uniref:Rz-like spanin n=1 Tax=Klebsiella phage BUCT610 TaxID=2834265 RepID=UPI001C74C36B|nr:Rz-like spanin [Klebsiella phage BUCT610]QWX10287.1 protein of unknown function DUF2514 [Klebsiella phage BUCT610]
MILQILKDNWKVVAAIIGIALLALIIYGKWVNYGKEKYNSGYLAAVEAQKVKDKEASEQHEQDKKAIEQEAQNRIDAARADASAAAVKSGRLQQQLATIRKQLVDYSHTESIGNPAASTGVLLSQLLSESVERNRQLAEYADSAREAGLTCVRQYESLRGGVSEQ